MQLFTTKEFIRRSRIIHGRRYTYSKSRYVNAGTKIKITCPRHGDFQQVPASHWRGIGCPQCGAQSISKSKRRTFEEFVTLAKRVHGKLYTYLQLLPTTVAGRDRKAKIVCKLHGLFLQNAGHHLNGHGCPGCYGGAGHKFTTKDFIRKAQAIHGNDYDYSPTQYRGANEKVKIRCPDHGVFEQRPADHWYGRGCIACNANRTISKKAIHWIEKEAASRRMKNVQHALNGGEYRIPGTRLKVDGYHARSKTVFEFHGDDFHGNLEKHGARSRPNPFSDKTAAQLHRETLQRERKLLSLGYNLIVTWERDYGAR